MSDKVDIKLEKTEATGGIYDIPINSTTKDVASDSSFDTNIQYSLFTDKRADESQVQQPENRRGWVGDAFTTFDGFQIGSLLWLLKQARLTPNTINKAVSFVKDSLQWVIDKGYATRIDVSGTPVNNEDIQISINIFVDDNLINSFVFRIWELSQYA